MSVELYICIQNYALDWQPFGGLLKESDVKSDVKYRFGLSNNVVAVNFFMRTVSV